MDKIVEGRPRIALGADTHLDVHVGVVIVHRGRVTPATGPNHRRSMGLVHEQMLDGRQIPGPCGDRSMESEVCV